VEGLIHTQHEHEHQDHVEEAAEDESREKAIKDEWLGVVMEEYRTLRREIIASLAMQQSALTLGTLAIGGLALAGFHEWSDEGSKLPLVVFLVVLPLVSYVSVFIWLGEYARATRAGEFIAAIEAKVNAKVGAEALGWETNLRTPKDGRTPQFAWNSWAIFVYFLLVVPVATVAVGNVSARGMNLTTGGRLGFDVPELVLFAAMVFFLCRVFKDARRAGGALSRRERQREEKPQERAPEMGAAQVSNP
jgi:hypothetical protein